MEAKFTYSMQSKTIWTISIHGANERNINMYPTLNELTEQVAALLIQLSALCVHLSLYIVHQTLTKATKQKAIPCHTS